MAKSNVTKQVNNKIIGGVGTKANSSSSNVPELKSPKKVNLDYVTKLQNEGTKRYENKVRNDRNYEKGIEQGRKRVIEKENRRKNYLNPNYKLTDEDIKDIQQGYDNYMNSHPLSYMATDPFGYMESHPHSDINPFSVMYMSPEEEKEMNLWKAKKSKSSKIDSFMYGMIDSAPIIRDLAKNAEGLVYGTNGEKTMGLSYADAIGNASVQNPITKKTGEITGKALQYIVANGILGEIGAFGKAGKSIANATNKITKGNATGEFAANLLRGQAADTLVDTLPNVVNDISEGKSGGEVALNALKNQGVNAAYNLGFETLPYVTKSAKKLLKEESGLTKALSNDNTLTDISKEILEDTETNLKPHELLRKSADEKIYSLTSDMNKATSDAEREAIAKEIQKINEETNNALYNNANIPSLDNVAKAETQNVPDYVRVEDEAKDLNTAISKHYETLKNSQMFESAENQAKLQAMKDKGVFDKTVENRVESMNKAARSYAENPDLVKEEVLNGKWSGGGIDVDKSALVINDALKTGDNDLLNKAVRKETFMLSNAGRELRAVQDNYVSTAEGTIVNAMQYMTRQANKLMKKGGATAKTISAMAENAINTKNVSELVARFGLDDYTASALKEAVEEGASKNEIENLVAMFETCKNTRLSDDMIQFVKDTYSKIEAEGFGVNSKQRAELEGEMYARIANEIGGKSYFMDKWDAWRYFAMLGNPRTHLRNIIGNGTQYMVSEIKDNVAAAIESVIGSGSKGFERTKAVLNRFSDADNELIKLARTDADKEAYLLLSEGGHKYNDITDVIKQNKDAFDTKFLNKLEKLNGNLLEGEDYIGLKNKYSKSLARYLKANGADKSIFEATDDASKELLEKARMFAADEAKKATFHEYSVVADWLSKTSQNLRSGDKANAGSKLIGATMESLIPFKKTPINVVKQAYKYSPLNVLSFVSDLATKKDTAKVIDDFASTLTGTGIFALGTFLASQGILNGKGNEDYNVKTADQIQGKQEYAINLGNGKSYTIDWLAPFALPLFVGAKTYNQFIGEEGSDEDTFDKVIGSLSTIADPVIEMSMLQGINDTLEQLSYSSESPISTFMGNMGTNYVTQGVPTLFGQVARSVDPTRRSTYTDKTGSIQKQASRNILKSLNKLPFASEMNEEYVNKWGQTEENTGGSLLGRLAYNMLSPGYYADNSKATSVDNELQRLYDSTNDSSVFEGTSSGKVGDNKLSREDYTKYQKLYGQTNFNLAQSIINNEKYQSLSDEDKAEIIDNAYGVSKKIADYEVGGKEIPESYKNIYSIYKKSGIEGVANTLIENRQKKIANEAFSQEAISNGFVKENGKADTSAYKKALEMSDKYGIDGNAYKEITSIKNGTNKDGETKYLSVNDKTLGIYSQKGAEGLQTYVDIKNSLSDDSVPSLLKAVDSANISPDDKAFYFTQLKGNDLSNVAKTFDDYRDIYLWYAIKSVIDTNGNGSLTKKEKAQLVPMLKSMNYSYAFINKVTNQNYKLENGKTHKGWY